MQFQPKMPKPPREGLLSTSGVQKQQDHGIRSVSSESTCPLTVPGTQLELTSTFKHLCSEFNVKSKCGYSRRNAESHTARKARRGDTPLSSCHPSTCSGRDPVTLQCEIVPPRAVGELRVSPRRKWGKVQMSNCCPQGAAGETSTQQRAEHSTYP